MATKKLFSIVQRNLGFFYKMDQTDFRFKDSINIGTIKRNVEKSVSNHNDRKVMIVELQDGQKFEVFSDWSARKI